jgi:hypothetical protein
MVTIPLNSELVENQIDKGNSLTSEQPGVVKMGQNTKSTKHTELRSNFSSPFNIAIKLLKAAIVITTICMLQGCITSAHLYSMATTSPGEKTCSLIVLIETSPLNTETSEIIVSGGFDGQETEMIAKVTKLYYPATNRTVWHLDGKHYWTKTLQCAAKSPLTIELSDNKSKLSASIPLTALLSEPIYGDFYLTIEGNKVLLHLYKNIGKTRYSYPAMSWRWDYEPKQQVFEVNFIESKP